MNAFMNKVGVVASNVVDGTVDLAEDAYFEAGVATSSFAAGYAEQHAKNVAAREAKRAARTRGIELIELKAVA